MLFSQNEQGKQIVPTSSRNELYKPTSVVSQRSIAPPAYPVGDLLNLFQAMIARWRQASQGLEGSR